MGKHLIAVALAMACGLTFAKGAKTVNAASSTPVVTASAIWDKEPDAFLGIKFGEVVPPALPICDAGVLLRAAGDLCVLRSGKTVDIQGLPDIGTHYFIKTTDMLKDGAVAGFVMTASQKDYVAIRDAFVTRYGAPTSRSIERVQTTGGADLESENLEWAGRKVSIRMKERYDSIDKTYVFLSDNAAEDEAIAERKARAASGAAAL